MSNKNEDILKGRLYMDDPDADEVNTRFTNAPKMRMCLPGEVVYRQEDIGKYILMFYGLVPLDDQGSENEFPMFLTPDNDFWGEGLEKENLRERFKLFSALSEAETKAGLQDLKKAFYYSFLKIEKDSEESSDLSLSEEKRLYVNGFCKVKFGDYTTFIQESELDEMPAESQWRKI